MKISIKEAKELSLLKWEYVLKNPLKRYYNDEIHYPPEYSKELISKLKTQYFNCGFCYRHDYRSPLNSINCKDCEFGKIAGKCLQDDSLYNMYLDAFSENDYNLFQKAAIKIIEAIKSIDEDEEI